MIVFNLVSTSILFNTPQVHFSSLESRSTAQILLFLGRWLGYIEEANLNIELETELEWSLGIWIPIQYST